MQARLREERSRPIVAQLREWVYATKPATLPQSSVGKAMEYMLSLWPGLPVFLTGLRVPLDNNAVERALRGVVVAAIFYTLFESVKLAGVDPHAHGLEATRRAIASPGAVMLPEDVT